MASDGSGQDPLANMQNLMGYAGLVGANPYLPSGGPDPNVPGGGLPKIKLPGYYTGTAGNLPPTNAMGQPIQSFVNANNADQQQYQQALAAYNAQPAGGAATPGTTLNSPPGQIQGGSIYNSTTPDMSRGIYSASPQGGYGLTMGQPYALSSFAAPGSYGNQNQADASGLAALMGMNPQRLNGLSPSVAAPAAASSGRGPPPAPPDLRQAYLTALAYPGPLPRYGAGPPQAGQTPTGTPPPNVNNAFLAANAGRSTPFINTLKQLQGSMG